MNALARFVALGSLPVVLLAAGCTSQGEGDRCKQNADCQADFLCVPQMSNSLIAVCCRADGTSTVALCNASAIAPDSGTPPTTTDAEAGTEEAATEAGSEVGEDAPAEAAGD